MPGSRTTSGELLLTVPKRAAAGRPSCVSSWAWGSPPSNTDVAVSATWPESVRRLAATFLDDPVRITVGSDELSANKRIEQIVEVLDQSFAKEYATILNRMSTY